MIRLRLAALEDLVETQGVPTCNITRMEWVLRSAELLLADVRKLLWVVEERDSWQDTALTALARMQGGKTEYSVAEIEAAWNPILGSWNPEKKQLINALIANRMSAYSNNISSDSVRRQE